MSLEDLISIIDKLNNEEICNIFNNNCTKCPFNDEDKNKCAIQNVISIMDAYKFRQKRKLKIK